MQDLSTSPSAGGITGWHHGRALPFFREKGLVYCVRERWFWKEVQPVTSRKDAAQPPTCIEKEREPVGSEH